jgi:hypothetical protein
VAVERRGQVTGRDVVLDQREAATGLLAVIMSRAPHAPKSTVVPSLGPTMRGALRCVEPCRHSSLSLSSGWAVRFTTPAADGTDADHRRDGEHDAGGPATIDGSLSRHRSD